MLRILPLLLIVAFIGCSGGRARPDDGGPDGDGGDDADSFDGDIEPPPPSTCGDGVLDEGEECDDGNRLNGDDCDWRCRSGAGDPPPEPDETVPLFDVDGEVVHYDEWQATAPDQMRLPFQFNQGLFAAAYPIGDGPPVPSSSYSIAFRRYDADGELVGSGWDFSINPNGRSFDCDLVSLEDGYGLFYKSEMDEASDSGFYFQLLDLEGKPLDEPVLVVQGYNLRAIDAVWAGDRFVITWSEPGTHLDEPGCTSRNARHPVWVREVGPNGETEGFIEPTLVGERARDESFPTIAAHSEGFGVLVTNESGSPDVSCYEELLLLDRELNLIGTTHALGASRGGEILADDEGYIAVWTHADTSELGDVQLCSARSSPTTGLTAAPVCTAPLPYELLRVSYARAALGADGIGALVTLRARDESFTLGEIEVLGFQRLDAAGVPLGSLVEVVHSPIYQTTFFDHAIAFGDGVFAAFYERQDYSSGLHFAFQRLTAEE